jgi:hypothetical protein
MRELAAIGCVVLFACSTGDVLLDLEARRARQPVITSVQTDDGFTEICQGCTAELNITGDELKRIESVVLQSPAIFEQIQATIIHTSKRQVRAQVTIPHGFTSLPLDVVITGPDGDATAFSAIQTTLVVVAPDAPPGGHGTFQSPIALCSTAAEQPRDFDVLLLLAGTHVCDRVLHLGPNVFVLGEGAGVTHVVGTGTGTRLDFDGTSATGTLQVENLTIEGAIDQVSIRVRGGSLFVFDVEDRGGVVVSDGFAAQIRGYRFDGPGRAIALEMRSDVRIENTTIQNCTEGIVLDVTRTNVATATFLILETTTIERCGLGLRIGTLPQAPVVEQRVQAFMQGVQLVDNTAGMLIQDGSSTFFESAIRAAPSPAVTSGIRLENGSLSLSSSELSGLSAIGLDIDTAATGGCGTVGIFDTSIVGGEIGVRARGFDRETIVTLLRTTVRDQTVAAVQYDGQNFLILGESFPSGNALSVRSGFALDDRRTTVTPATEFLPATGTTLNGHSYAGQVLQGPLSIGSDIRITSPEARWGF